uniref:Succinate dehydrogenase [ubiquinone] cytochrome b small subunit n=1 Tax=Ostreococcus mediterraneus TaxID=1486918 RepID=A0A7S0KM59_9CHLO|mmetsp:Transcript_722/g.2801  ORF Transcript_722/g.2801 Transcript_722/m.2801 type:complete len:109 (+) Transcript_722:33-359(+)
MSSMLAADSGRAMMKIYHGSSFALAGLVPAAAMLPGGSLPIDVALGVALPVHSHIALNFIISDYCPKAMRGPTRAATLALTVATLVGLFQLNTKGEGVTRAVKSLWKA